MQAQNDVFKYILEVEVNQPLKNEIAAQNYLYLSLYISTLLDHVTI